MRDGMIGRKFGRLKVIKLAGTRSRWLCRCKCGNEIIAITANLNNGHTKSCGCLLIERRKSGLARKHGESTSRTYTAWRNMKQVCENENHLSHHLYGGRGIRVCEQWKKFDGFLADMGRAPEGLTLGRIDNNADFQPSNCKWMLPKVRRSRLHNVAENYCSE